MYESVPRAPVAQMDRAAASGAAGHRFESCRAYHYLPLISSTLRTLSPLDAVSRYSLVSPGRGAESGPILTPMTRKGRKLAALPADPTLPSSSAQSAPRPTFHRIAHSRGKPAPRGVESLHQVHEASVHVRGQQGGDLAPQRVRTRLIQVEVVRSHDVVVCLEGGIPAQDLRDVPPNERRNVLQVPLTGAGVSARGAYPPGTGRRQ